MSIDPFQSFLDLIEYDQKILTFKKNLQGLQAALEKIGKERNQLDAQLKSSKKNVHDAQFLVDEKELEMKVLEDLEKDKKKKLDLISSPKEYTVLSSEINNLKKKQHDFEEELLATWHQLEIAKRNDAQISHDIHEKNVVLEAAAQEKEQEKNALQTAIANLEKERDSYLVNVPAEWLEKYTSMREQVSDPVVPVQYGSCSACFHNILEKDMALLRHNALLQCKGCFRFLYLPETRRQASS